jgi:hypothetical protein
MVFNSCDVVDEVGHLPTSTLSAGKVQDVVWVVIGISRVIDHVCHLQGNVGTVSRGDEIVGTAAGDISRCVHTNGRQLEGMKRNETKREK